MFSHAPNGKAVDSFSGNIRSNHRFDIFSQALLVHSHNRLLFAVIRFSLTGTHYHITTEGSNISKSQVKISVEINVHQLSDQYFQLESRKSLMAELGNDAMLSILLYIKSLLCMHEIGPIVRNRCNYVGGETLLRMPMLDVFGHTKTFSIFRPA